MKKLLAILVILAVLPGCALLQPKSGAIQSATKLCGSKVKSVETRGKDYSKVECYE